MQTGLGVTPYPGVLYYTSNDLASLVVANSRINLLRATTYLVFEMTEMANTSSPIGTAARFINTKTLRGRRQRTDTAQINLPPVACLRRHTTDHST